MLGYGNTPAGPQVLRPWMTCPAGSWPPLAGGRGRPAATGHPSAPKRTRSTADPGRLRACLTRPKSCRYHFAAEVLLALI